MLNPPLGVRLNGMPDLGYFITKVVPNSEAAKKNLVVGLRVVSVNGTKTVGCVGSRDGL